MDKLTQVVLFRLTPEESRRVELLSRGLGAERSLLCRLAIKRLLRKPPTRRFRYRMKRSGLR